MTCHERSHSTSPVIATRCDFEEDFDTPAFFSRNEILSDIRKHSDSLTSQVGLESLCDVLNCLNNAVLAGADFMQAVRQIEMHTAGSDIAEFVVRISIQEGIASEQVWVIVLDWPD
ncbi:hypothetical protein AGMMS49925_11070 [Deltaproteobacteria bacterium]|nr:hypothetical protein AGMMS49925_11070 [Deltaproteobacteria bacterium]